MNIKSLTRILILVTCLGFFSCSKGSTGSIVQTEPGNPPGGSDPAAQHTGTAYEVAMGGNSFVTTWGGASAGARVTPTGIKNWNSNKNVISTYVKVPKKGKLRISFKGNTLKAGDESTIEVRVNKQKRTFLINSITLSEYMVGDFAVSEGYIKIDLQAKAYSGSFVADINSMLVSGEATGTGITYSTKPDMYYWARRGPSCHLSYTIPTSKNVSYYYSEIMVPEGEDQIGSYFMANGFGEGYFGIQVNSSSERRVLFSVWSPFDTDDPNSIPDDQKIILNKKGKDVHTGEFGNEGSGGQSFLRYGWKAGSTYKFLLKGEPDGTGKTDYTAWFYKPETQEWALIASFKRPKTNTYLKRFHSFLENFSPDNGYLGRQATYKNQWVRTDAGAWLKVSEATFTVDNTYNSKQRVDAIGGNNKDGFFLRNGGFFSDYVAPSTKFSFVNPSEAPQIDLSKLP